MVRLRVEKNSPSPVSGVLERIVELGDRRAGRVRVAGEALAEGDVLRGTLLISGILFQTRLDTDSPMFTWKVGTIERRSAVGIDRSICPLAHVPINERGP